MYVAPDLGQLERRIDKKERVWCGWEHFLGGPDNECTAHVNPFGESVIAIADNKDKNHFTTGMHLPLLSSLPVHADANCPTEISRPLLPLLVQQSL